MVKILVVYDSESGNTEKMAYSVAEGARRVSGTTVIIRKADVTTIQDLTGASGIIIGSPTYYGQMSSKVKALIDMSGKVHGELDGKVGAAFTSAGGIATGAETTLISVLQAMLIHGMIIKGRSDDQHYGVFAEGAPDQEALQMCEDLGKSVATLAKRLGK